MVDFGISWIAACTSLSLQQYTNISSLWSILRVVHLQLNSTALRINNPLTLTSCIGVAPLTYSIGAGHWSLDIFSQLQYFITQPSCESVEITQRYIPLPFKSSANWHIISFRMICCYIKFKMKCSGIFFINSFNVTCFMTILDYLS